MSLLNKLFGRDTTTDEPAAPIQETCHHLSAVPHWDNPDDIGVEELATSSVCQSCMKPMDPEEYDHARTAEMERLRGLVAAE